MSSYLRSIDGSAHPLSQPRTTVGREGCNLDLPYRGVSVRHATIILEDDTAWIQDEGSKNGTFLNGLKVEAGCRTKIREGDIIQFSRSKVIQYIYRIGQPTEDALPDLWPVLSMWNAYLDQDELLQQFLKLTVHFTHADRGVLLSSDMIRIGRGVPISSWPVAEGPPGTLLDWGISEKLVRDAAASRDRVVRRSEHAVLCFPVFLREVVNEIQTARQEERELGILYLECDSPVATFDDAQQQLVQELVDRVALSLEAARRARLEFEMRAAAEIQTQLLPRDFERWSGFDFHARNIPAALVSGDFFEFVEIGVNHLGIAVGDVTGHGLPAAVMMTGIMASVWNNARNFRGPAAVLRAINDYACLRMPPGRNVTLLFGEVHSSGLFTWVCGGHSPPIVIRNIGRVEQFGHDGGALPVGVVSSEEWGAGIPVESWVQLNAGDLVVVYTDGVIEAPGVNELYGRPRLLSLLTSLPSHLSCREVVDSIWRSLCDFSGDDSFPDDVTLLVFRYVGDRPEMARGLSSF